jgi:hypothetical protein
VKSPLESQKKRSKYQAELLCSHETQAELTWRRSFWNDSSASKFYWRLLHFKKKIIHDQSIVKHLMQLPDFWFKNDNLIIQNWVEWCELVYSRLKKAELTSNFVHYT